MAQTPEGKIKMKLDKMLKEFEPDLWFYSPQSGIYGKSGVPDRVCCFKGRFIGVECKASRDRPATDLQMATMKAISRAGGRCFIVADDATIETVHEYLISLKAKDRVLG